MAQMVKYFPAMQETWVQFRGREDPLEKRMATHSSIFFFFHFSILGESHGQSSLVGYSPWGSQRVRHD